MAPDFLSAIEEQLTNELPFVIYRKPKTSITTAIFQDDDALNIIEDFSETGFVFAPFDTDRPAYLLKPDRIIKESMLYESKSIKSKEPGNLDSEDRESYTRLVRKAITEIENGIFDKVVLSRSIKVECHKQPLYLVQSFISRYSNALCYLWYHPKVGMWLGATPEILLHAANNRLTTMSLAGTQKFMGDQNPEWGAKEKQEQELVTEYIEVVLKEHINNLMVSEVESIRAGNLLHLRTKLMGVMNNNLKDIIEALHPTPAICGMPMYPAKEFILNNESHDRQFYTGFLGELNLKNENERAANKKNHENKAYRSIKTETELFVNLRCMRLKDNQATIYVGGGVTKDSTPEKEWEETVTKSRTILDALLN